MRWDPEQYLQFRDERARPFADLMSRVPAEDPQHVVDLGCGPGNLTRRLADRWPNASVEGIDSSAEMIGQAEPLAGPNLRFRVADLREWHPRRPVDVLTCNATLQWVPGHLTLVPQLLARVRPGGWFAFQVPGNFGERTHTAITETCALPRWRHRLAGLELAEPFSHEPSEYLDVLAADARQVDAWEATYLQVLPGPDAVVHWMRGTGLRPVLSALDDDESEDFLDNYRALTTTAYPERPFGTVLPYRRIFAVAQR